MDSYKFRIWSIFASDFLESAHTTKYIRIKIQIVELKRRNSGWSMPVSKRSRKTRIRQLSKSRIAIPPHFRSYLIRRSPVLQQAYLRLSKKDFRVIEAYRTATLITGEIQRFLAAIRLTIGLEIRGGSLGSSGPEIVTLDGLSLVLRRYAVRSLSGPSLDQNQQMLLLEFQILLFNLLSSLGTKSDEIFELASERLVDHSIGRFAMMTTLRRSWLEHWFWDGYIYPSVIFNERLLESLKSFLVRSYEGRPSTASVWVTDRDYAYRLRWTPFISIDSDFLTQTKMGRVLSNSFSNSSFFYSGEGEFLGLFDTKRALRQLGLQNRQELPKGMNEWRIDMPGRLQFFISGKLRLEYRDGNWRYVDQDRDYHRVCQIQRSLATHNSKVWEAAVVLSSRQRSAIFVIADSAKKLLDDGVCSEDDLNLQHNCRMPMKPKYRKSTIKNPVIGPYFLTGKQFMMEQIRSRFVSQLGVDLLVTLASIDGAVVLNTSGRLLGFGVILQVSGKNTKFETEGAGARAARLISFYGTAIKVSQDGPISAFSKGLQIF